MKREFRRPKRRLADSEVICSSVIKSSKKEEREAEAGKGQATEDQDPRTKAFRVHPLLGGEERKIYLREMFWRFNGRRNLVTLGESRLASWK